MSERKTKALDVYSVFKAEYMYSYKMQSTIKHTHKEYMFTNLIKLSYCCNDFYMFENV